MKFEIITSFILLSSCNAGCRSKAALTGRYNTKQPYVKLDDTPQYQLKPNPPTVPQMPAVAPVFPVAKAVFVITVADVAVPVVQASPPRQYIPVEKYDP
jgi:hypothetical protein